MLLCLLQKSFKFRKWSIIPRHQAASQLKMEISWGSNFRSDQTGSWLENNLIITYYTHHHTICYHVYSHISHDHYNIIITNKCNFTDHKFHRISISNTKLQYLLSSSSQAADSIDCDSAPLSLCSLRCHQQPQNHTARGTRVLHWPNQTRSRHTARATRVLHWPNQTRSRQTSHTKP